MSGNGNLLLLLSSKICLNQIFIMSIFATKGIGHYLDDPRYEGIFGYFCMIFSKLCQMIFNIWKIQFLTGAIMVNYSNLILKKYAVIIANFLSDIHT